MTKYLTFILDLTIGNLASLCLGFLAGYVLTMKGWVA